MITRCLFLLNLCWVSHLTAQTFHAVPGPLLQQEIQFNQANECYIHFDNPGGDSLQLHWRLLDSNLPAEWHADLCDYGLCYNGIPSNGLMNVVYDTIQPYLKLIVQPDSVPGATWIWFRAYEEGNEDNYVDVFYSLHTPGTLTTQTQDDAILRIYPNPATDVLLLENSQANPGQAQIVNANGQMMWQGLVPAAAQARIGVGEWPNGIYFLQQGNRIQKILVRK